MIIETDDLIDELEHNIVVVDGIVMLIPSLLASDVAHSILIDFDDDIELDTVMYRCADKLDDIYMDMVNSVKVKLKDNGREVW